MLVDFSSRRNYSGIIEVFKAIYEKLSKVFIKRDDTYIADGR